MNQELRLPSCMFFSRNKRKKQPGLRKRQTGLEIDEMQGL